MMVIRYMAGTDRDALKAQFEAHVNAKSEAAAQVPRCCSGLRLRCLLVRRRRARTLRAC